MLWGSAFLTFLCFQGIYDTFLCKGYKLILCAQRHKMLLFGFAIHV